MRADRCEASQLRNCFGVGRAEPVAVKITIPPRESACHHLATERGASGRRHVAKPKQAYRKKQRIMIPTGITAHSRGSSASEDPRSAIQLISRRIRPREGSHWEASYMNARRSAHTRFLRRTNSICIEYVRPLPGSTTTFQGAFSGGIAALIPRLCAATPRGVVFRLRT
jgi:hypothetical protein